MIYETRQVPMQGANVLLRLPPSAAGGSAAATRLRFVRAAGERRLLECSRAVAPDWRVSSSWMAKAATATHKRATIVLFGDSITEQSLSAQGGWGTRLADHYVRVAAQCCT